jgi:hypothetical protein
MPIMIQCLDIIRVNSFIIAKNANKALSHKAFVCDLIASLNTRGSRNERPPTRASIAQITSPLALVGSRSVAA